ncbi:MAG: DUF262 domain-containing protein [Muribaculaceae bacterium]|nr:DUF262 domain-containing protein [Muribaculaceae bacterium]
MKKTMVNYKSSQKISFWKFLKTTKIEIPIIQRDYAQGRLGKEYLRKRFLSNLREALNNKQELKLDFVYGSTESGTFYPLDGQQRLTTLWLLHWYVALMSDNLNEDICKVLEKFTYETRISSREFCKNLCNPKYFENYADYKPESSRRIVGFITSRTWFYSAWKQDPTIQAMLRMLGGTQIKDKDNKDIIDGLEELFPCPLECHIQKNEKFILKRSFKNYWDALTGDDCPIVFYHFPFKDFGLSGDLYIKMNARGKQLTAFENFKADLIGYIRKQAEESTDNKTQKDWNELLDAKNGIPKLMDTTWTDIFWNNKSEEYSIDEIYFAFINRFFLNELVCQKDNNNEYLYTAKQLEEDNPIFSYLYGDKSDDTIIDYVGFERYKDIPLSFLKNLSNTLSCIPYAINLSSFNPKWVGQDFQYIPIYKEISISSFEQKDRIAFHAISKYIQKGTFDAVSFQQWMRVVWNIVENAGVNSISSMIGVMRLIDELSEHSHVIYSFLSKQDSLIKSSAAKEQVYEERVKAKHICNKDFREEDIIYAESHPLLKGCISVIFKDDKCDEVSFGQTIRKRTDLLDELYNADDDYKLVKVLVSQYNNHQQVEKLKLKKDPDNWKSLVTDKLKDCYRKNENNVINNNCSGWQSMISKTPLINNSRDLGKILGGDGKRTVLWATNGCTWIAYENVILDKVHNNPSLSELVRNKTIECNQKVKDCDFFWGQNIDFKYNEHFFRWYDNPNEKELDVYLMEDNWKEYKLRSKGRDRNTDEGKTDEDTYYCFRVEDGITPEQFLNNLDDLIKEHNNSASK